MWGELAGRLGATDINATLEKIGNAVAPREDDEDSYDDEDGSDGSYDDEEYEEDDEDEDYGEGDRQGIMNKVAVASPFRLAGILTRVLDDRLSEKGYDADSGINSPSGEKVSRTIDDLPRELVGNKNDGGNYYHVGKSEQTGDAEQRTKKTRRMSSQLPNSSKEYEIEPIEVNLFGGAQLVKRSPKCIEHLHVVEEVALEDPRPLQEAMEKMSSNKTTNAQIAGSTTNEENSESNDLKSNENTGRNMHLKNINETDVDMNISSRQNVSLNFSEVHAPIITEKKADVEDGEEEEMEAIGELLSTLMPRMKGDVAVHGKLQGRILENNENSKINKADTSKASNFYSAQTSENLNVSPTLDTHSPDNMIERNDNDSNSEIAIKALPRNLNRLEDGSSHATPLPDNETRYQNAHDEINVEQSSATKNLEQNVLAANLNYEELKVELQLAKEEIKALQAQSRQDKEKAKSETDDLIAKFRSKEARILEATSEENQNQKNLLEKEYSAKIQSLEHLLVKEREEKQGEHDEYKRLLRESYANADQMENQLRTTVEKYENQMAQLQQREDRALRKVDDRMAQTMAILDERDEEIKRLKSSIREMESKVNEHQEGEEEAEEELEEVHQENDSLRQTIEKLELQKKNLEEKVSKLKSGSEELSALQMELTMFKEERDRERSKNQAVMDSAMSSHTHVETERDDALSELKDLKQQLAATLGDLEVARADYSRLLMANENLQSALEAFQDERQAEIEMIDEQRRESEEALKFAHATATSALKQIHETEMFEIQKACDNAVKKVMEEMESVETNLRNLKSENNQMRRSLDEAIHRLQTSQEDIIDRNIMKNILLDWCTLNDKSKRHQVLQVMANLLHFSEVEKEKVHLTSKSLDSVRAKVVGALAAPLPPSKADLEHLEGSNVHEKWINFLMAETDDI